MRGVYPILRLSDREPVAPAPRRRGGLPTDIATWNRSSTRCRGATASSISAASRGENTWEKNPRGNIVGLYNTLRRHEKQGVSACHGHPNHAVGFYPRSQTIDHQVTAATGQPHGVSKAFSEALASLYSDKHGMGFFVSPHRQLGTHPIDSRRSRSGQPARPDPNPSVRLEHPMSATRSSTASPAPALVVRQFQRLYRPRVPAGRRFRAQAAQVLSSEAGLPKIRSPKNTRVAPSPRRKYDAPRK